MWVLQSAVFLRYFNNSWNSMSSAQPLCLEFFWNSAIHIFLQTHNLQRIIFRIFISHLKYKTDFKQSKKITKLASMGSWGYPHPLATDIYRDKSLLEIKSTFPFFSRCFSRSFLHKPISRLSCCVSSSSVTLISSVGFHDSSVSQSFRWYLIRYFLQNALIHPVYLDQTTICTFSKHYKEELVGQIRI